MKRLITVRHGQSESNRQGVIQGKTTNLGLTERGKIDIRDVVNQNIEELSTGKRIVSSPYKRAIETSEIIAKETGLPIIASDKIVEFDSGILAGNTHEENAKMYPEYYKIWLERKDLDGIPGAEKGSELQARVLAFLIEYYNKDEFSDIVVSHAGFLRCLINTSKGLSRTTPVDSRNGAINIIDNPFKHLKVEHKDRAMASKVFVVETFDGKYVVKLKDRKLLPEDYEERRILNLISTDLGSIPTVLSLVGTGNSSSKVLKFVNGETIYGILDESSKQALIEKFCKMSDVLTHIESKVYKPNDIYEEIVELEDSTKHTYVKKYGQSILKDKVNKFKLESSKYCLIHNDLNRDNILFEKNEEGSVRVNIIDWEGLGLYPCDYQLASFLVSAILLEGYSVEETMKIAMEIDPNIDEDFITYLMKFRIFKGLYFFAENRNIYTVSNQKASNEILKKYFFAAEKLDKYIEKNKFINTDEKSQEGTFQKVFQSNDEREL